MLGIVAEEVARSRAERGGAVAGIAQAAPFEGKAAAADAGVELVAQAFEQPDALVEHGPPLLGQPVPVRRTEGVIIRKGGEGPTDLLEREPDPLGDLDERHPPEHRPCVAALAAIRTV